MIVRCPECSTGFKLPADRVGPKGAKVRCTKCDHVFRVRVADGEPEIFYKPGEEPAAASQANNDAGNRTAFGGPHSFATEDVEESDVRETGGHTAIGRPGDLKNLRSTPRKPLASVDKVDEPPASPKAPMAAGIINKRTIKKTSEPEDEEFSGPGMAHAVSEADDSTAIGKPIDDGYSPKATSFGLPAVSGSGGSFGGDDPFGDEDSEEPADTSNTSFGFPVDSEEAPPARGFGEVDEEDEDDDLRGTAFGRPAFQDDEAAPADEPQFGDNPKGTLFGLPAVGGGEDDAPDEAPASPTVEVDAGLDLFEDEVAPPEPEEFDEDPFAGAFEDNIEASPGADDGPALDDEDPFAFGGGSDRNTLGEADDSFADAFGAGNDFAPSGGGIEVDDDDDDDSANFFTGGGGGSDFGDPSELVDPTFGSDGPSFDPNAGEVEADTSGSAEGHGNISFGDSPAPEVDLVMETSPPPAAERERAARGKKSKKAKKEAPTSAPAARSGQRRAVATAHEGGPVQKVMNLLLIVMLVVSAFVGVVLYKTGGVIDFARFDHMLAIVIDGEAFEPRPEWGIEKRTTDNVVPLKTANVFAYPSPRKDGEAFVVSGQINNEGTSAYSGIKVRVSLVGPDGSMLADQTVPGGTSVDTRKLKNLAPDKFDEAVERQMSNVSPDDAIPFVAVFKELPTNSVDELQVLVEVTEKSEIPNGEK